ncbi:hypothetical protein E8E13_008941 [Curvularia kusanoi]|uniref:Uncharacterized protein n=1 Tax=Curvularia kusanoi TaxID=90978 RepID=A0A9P4WBG8_CURKU|nr:hypothetical protein E8E13_008941 [Curvularia kusanoi]
MSNRYYWLRIAPTFIVLIELTSAISLTIIFGCALSLALDTQAFTTPSLPTLDSADLSLFSHLKPLARGLAITGALTTLLTLLALTASLMELQNRRTQARDTRAFEPTVSALGMSHGFHALHPQPHTTTIRQAIPTMYDPYKAFQKGGPGGTLRITKQVAFADEATWMSQSRKHAHTHATSRWSASTSSPKKIEGDIMRLLEVKKARRAVPVRPAAAWTEIPRSAPEPQPQPQLQPVAVHRSTASLAAEGRSNCI